MPAKVVRRIRLPADRYTPALARAAVRSVVTEAALDDLLDEALLLTTEVTTNGVIHADTEIDVDVVAQRHSITITVTDFRPAPLPLPGRPPAWHGPRELAGAGRGDLLGELAMPDEPRMPVELAEHGRGLALINHFASSWGTVHRSGGKAVWFRLDRPGIRAEVPSSALTQEQSPPAPAALEWLTRAEFVVTEEIGIADAAAELLRRLCAVTGATGARVELDQGGGRGGQPVAGHGHPARTEPVEVRVDLPVSRPWRGNLTLSMEGRADPYARPLAELVATRLALTLEKERFRDNSARRRSWLMYLAEVSELLAQSLDVDLTLALIPRLLVPRLGEWCAVHRADEWGDLHLAAAVHANEDELEPLLDALASSGPDGVDARLREAFRGARTTLPPPLDGYTLPLVARGQHLGTLSIGRPHDHWMDPDEAAVADDVARRCALAIDNARIHADRNHVARTLQESLLPPALPVVHGIAMAAQYVPSAAGVEVGGDFYDVLPMPDDGWLVVIGDVSGKGVQAATVTGLVRNVIRVLVQDNKPIPEMLKRLNETLIERGGGRYCTLAAARIEGGDIDIRRRMRLYLAGHERPVLLRADGETTLVGISGTALGLLETVVSPPVDITLEPGDGLVFYTDGITERRRGMELFGVHRLQAATGRLAGLPADVIAARLRATVMSFSPDPPRDDIAILALRNQPPGIPATRFPATDGTEQRGRPA